MEAKEVCQHDKTYIVILNGFAAVETIGYKCEDCGEIVKTVKQ